MEVENFKNLMRPPPAMICKRWKPWIPNNLESILNPKELQLKVLLALFHTSGHLY